MMKIKCNVLKKEFNIKKICHISEMPKNAKTFWSVYTDTGVYEIYKTAAGVLYSKPLR